MMGLHPRVLVGPYAVIDAALPSHHHGEGAFVPARFRAVFVKPFESLPVVFA